MKMDRVTSGRRLRFGRATASIAVAGALAALAVGIIPSPRATAGPTPVLSIPIRWCVVGNDANDNGIADAGEEGAPAFADPGMVGEPDTDNVLWRRHERTSDNTYIPDAGITFRSGIYNIVEDATLRFPIIPDPFPDASGFASEEPGDIIDPRDSGQEWTAVENACIDAWREDHGVENLGLLVVNANRIIRATHDDPFDAVGIAPSGGLSILLRDSAYMLPGSPLNSFAVSDHVDKHLGHEIGHAMPVEADGDGLPHTCVDTNIMRNGRRDPDGDGLVNNFRLSTNVEQVVNPGLDDTECTSDDTLETIDQAALLRAAAEATAGCKIAGTNDDCTNLSDVRADRLGDALPRVLDLSFVTLTESSNGSTIFEHKLAGPLRSRIRSFPLGTFSMLDYYFLVDADDDPATGGGPDELAAIGAPKELDGVEVVTRVRLAAHQKGRGFTVSGTLWRLRDDRFVEVAEGKTQGEFAPVSPIVTTDTGETVGRPIASRAILTVPSEAKGPLAETTRFQAVSVGVPLGARAARSMTDRLDRHEEPPTFRLRSPEFPICKTDPAAVQAGATFEAAAQGLLPDSPVHGVLGDRLLATGTTDGDGDTIIDFNVPGATRAGSHLVTIGVDDTALTADCIVLVRGKTKDRPVYVLIVGLVVAALVAIGAVLIRRSA